MIHVVLYEPEIPQNTGNIMRTCAVWNCRLHLIGPLGFKMDEKHLRRAGMDYIRSLTWKVYPDWETFRKENPDGQFFFATRYGRRPPDSFDFRMEGEEIYLVFGKESTGIPKAILKENLDRCMRIPMAEGYRSLNLSNCAAICIYEVLRQNGFAGLSAEETIKGSDFLERASV